MTNSAENYGHGPLTAFTKPGPPTSLPGMILRYHFNNSGPRPCKDPADAATILFDPYKIDEMVRSLLNAEVRGLPVPPAVTQIPPLAYSTMKEDGG
jgi:hypothetical protein